MVTLLIVVVESDGAATGWTRGSTILCLQFFKTCFANGLIAAGESDLLSVGFEANWALHLCVARVTYVDRTFSFPFLERGDFIEPFQKLEGRFELCHRQRLLREGAGEGRGQVERGIICP